MSSATVLLIVAIISLAVSIASGIYIWRRHSYSVRADRFHLSCARAQIVVARAHIAAARAYAPEHIQRRAYALAEMAAANDQTDADATDYG